MAAAPSGTNMLLSDCKLWFTPCSFPCLPSSTDCDNLPVYVGSNKPSPEMINITASAITITECMYILARINPNPIPRPIKPVIAIFFSLKCFNNQGNNNARETISHPPHKC